MRKLGDLQYPKTTLCTKKMPWYWCEERHIEQYEQKSKFRNSYLYKNR